MPEFWQFPTVSMGLGPIMAIYQARFLKYLHNRELLDTEPGKSGAFLGMEKPMSLNQWGPSIWQLGKNWTILFLSSTATSSDWMAQSAETAKFIQELEGEFRGAGWNVIKVLWGSYWDPLLAKDDQGLLRKRMEEAIDGDTKPSKPRGVLIHVPIFLASIRNCWKWSPT